MQNRRALLIAVSLLTATLFSGCDSESDLPATSKSCPANAAMITVSDGYLETICGCAEAAPAYYAPGSRLLCTVTAGTTVIFNYLVTHSQHQILATGTPSFPPSPVSNPTDQTVIRVHAVR